MIHTPPAGGHTGPGPLPPLHDRNWDQFRSNGIPFASAGAAWQMFGVEILKQMGVENEIHVEIFNRIDTIMAEIDAIDVGMNIDMKYGISPIISSFIPVNGTNDEIEAAFNEALNFTKLYIIREIKAFQYLELSKFQAWEVLKGNQEIAIFDTANPAWREIINEHWNETSNVQLVVYPDTSGAWRVQSAPGENTLLGGNGFAIRCKAPEEWLGKNNSPGKIPSNPRRPTGAAPSPASTESGPGSGQAPGARRIPTRA